MEAKFRGTRVTFEKFIKFYCSLKIKSYFIIMIRKSYYYYNIYIQLLEARNDAKGAGIFEWPSQTTEDVCAVSTIFFSIQMKLSGLLKYHLSFNIR